MVRVEITVTRYQKACPYCKIKPLVRKTCGSPECQFKHHIILMRQRPRKTDQKRPTALIQF